MTRIVFLGCVCRFASEEMELSGDFHFQICEGDLSILLSFHLTCISHTSGSYVEVGQFQ